MEDTWLGVLSIVGDNHTGPWQIKVSQFLFFPSLFPFPPYSPWTRQDTQGNSPFTDYFTDQSGVWGQEKGADGASPLLQGGGQGSCSPGRSASPWTDWTYQVQVTLKLRRGDLHWPTTVKSRTSILSPYLILTLCLYYNGVCVQEHPIFLNQFNSPPPDRRNMLLSCCAMFKAMFPANLDPLVLLYRVGQICGRGKSWGVKKTATERKQSKDKDLG